MPVLTTVNARRGLRLAHPPRIQSDSLEESTTDPMCHLQPHWFKPAAMNCLAASKAEGLSSALRFGAWGQVSEPRAARYGRSRNLNPNGHHQSLCPPAGTPLFPSSSKLTRRGFWHVKTRPRTRHPTSHEAPATEVQPSPIRINSCPLFSP